jgi:hypothetical protein
MSWELRHKRDLVEAGKDVAEGRRRVLEVTEAGREAVGHQRQIHRDHRMSVRINHTACYADARNAVTPLAVRRRRRRRRSWIPHLLRRGVARAAEMR